MTGHSFADVWAVVADALPVTQAQVQGDRAPHTHGYYSDKLTPEEVRDHFDEIRDENGYIVPASIGDEFADLMKHFS